MMSRSLDLLLNGWRRWIEMLGSVGPQSRSIPLLLKEEEREGMRAACRFNAELMDVLRPEIEPGVTTAHLDRLAYEYTIDHGHTPACLGYPNPRSGYPAYPKTICTSVNEVVCHGIPNDTPLRSGDIVNIDLTTIVDGWHGDQSETFLIGEVSDEARRLVQATFDCMFLGIDACKPYGRVNEIGRAIEQFIHPLGFQVVREFQGHGVGRQFHQEPSIPHFPQRGYRQRLDPGTCFTVEPMINVGVWRTSSEDPDGWTVRTRDGKLSAQFEHTVLMTEEGPDILTLTKNGPQRGHKF